MQSQEVLLLCTVTGYVFLPSFLFSPRNPSLLRAVESSLTPRTRRPCADCSQISEYPLLFQAPSLSPSSASSLHMLLALSITLSTCYLPSPLLSPHAACPLHYSLPPHATCPLHYSLHMLLALSITLSLHMLLALSTAPPQVLTHLLNLLGHFPLGCGAAQMSSVVREYHDCPSLQHLDELSSDIFDSPRVQVRMAAWLSAVAY